MFDSTQPKFIRTGYDAAKRIKKEKEAKQGKGAGRGKGSGKAMGSQLRALLGFLEKKELLPAVFFIFSKKKCDEMVDSLGAYCSPCVAHCAMCGFVLFGQSVVCLW